VLLSRFLEYCTSATCLNYVQCEGFLLNTVLEQAASHWVVWLLQPGPTQQTSSIAAVPLLITWQPGTYWIMVAARREEHPTQLDLQANLSLLELGSM
jgi:hypothetical protein